MSERSRKNQRVKADRTDLRAAFESSRQESAALREAVGRFLELAQGVKLADRTTYADGEARAGDGANPEKEGGKRWMTPKEMAEHVLLTYPLVMTVGAQQAALARERLVLYAMHARELHQKERPGCKCLICANAQLAMAGMAGNVRPPPLTMLVLDEAADIPPAMIAELERGA